MSGAHHGAHQDDGQAGGLGVVDVVVALAGGLALGLVAAILIARPSGQPPVRIPDTPAALLDTEDPDRAPSRRGKKE